MNAPLKVGQKVVLEFNESVCKGTVESLSPKGESGYLDDAVVFKCPKWFSPRGFRFAYLKDIRVSETDVYGTGKPVTLVCIFSF